MSFLNLLTGAPTTPATPDAPAPAADPTQAPTTATAPATTTTPAPAPTPDASATPAPAANPFNIAALAGAAGAPVDAPAPADLFANNLVAAALDGSGQPAAQAAPQVRAEVFAQAMAEADFTQGVDFAALETAMTNGEDAGAALRGAMQQSAMNAVHAMVPLVNAMSTAVHDSTLQSALQQGSQNGRSEQIISAFTTTYPYASNPVVSGLIGNFANTLASKAPPTATPAELASAMHDMFSNMSGHIAGTGVAAPVEPGVSNDFADLFGAPT